MVNISFEVGGRKVSSDQFGAALEKAALEQIADSIKKKLSSVRCNEHGERPSVKIKGNGLSDLKFEVCGCCQGLIDQATKKI